MKLIDRYITREILKPFAVVVIFLAGLFASFSCARLLAGAVSETLGTAAMLTLVMLKTLIALEVLVPIALYVSIIIGLGRLNKDQELNVLRSAGVSGARIVYAVLIVAIPVSIISGVLAAYARPWAYTESYLLNAQAEADLNTNRFQAGRFYGSEGSGRVVFVQSKDESDQSMQQIFHYVRKKDSTEITVAQEARQHALTESTQPNIQLTDGYIYNISHAASIDDVIQFKKLTFYTDNDQVVNYKRKAASTRKLWDSEKPREIAELQWRLSRPFATILLALFAVSFIRTAPRQDKGDKTYLIAALVFASYYNLSGLAQTWVEQGVVAEFPGVWWLYVCMLVVLLLVAFRSNLLKLVKKK